MTNFEISQPKSNIETKKENEKLENPEEIKEIEAQKEEFSANLKGLEEDLKKIDPEKISKDDLKMIRDISLQFVHLIGFMAGTAGATIIAMNAFASIQSMESVIMAVTSIDSVSNDDKELVMTIAVVAQAIKFLGF